MLLNEKYIVGMNKSLFSIVRILIITDDGTK